MTKGLAKARKLAPVLLIAALPSLTACGSSSATDAASAMGGKGPRVKVNNGNGGGSSSTTGGSTTTSTPTPIPTPTGTATYDTSIGAGVDANGFADLPLRSGAHRYFVNSSAGSDNNSCASAQSAATPKASLASAVGCIAQGNGDQVLVAEGRTYAERLPVLYQKDGNSLLYPTVIESYDPADPLNEAKYGRATSGRPVFTGSNSNGSPFMINTPAQSFIAVRGLDINPGNITGQSLGMVDVGSGILFENNILRYTGLAFVINASPRAQHWIVRNNAIYGTWDDTTATAGHGIYADGCDTLTIEDNVFWHNGWKVGASRDDTLANGGASMFRHPVYQQTTTDAIFRRNLVADGAGDGGSFRGNATVTENLSIDNPIAYAVGASPHNDRPAGVDLTVAYNAVMGGADVISSLQRGWGIWSQNGRSGSSAHHNLLVQSYNVVSGNAFRTTEDFSQPSYMDYHDNVSSLFNASGFTFQNPAMDPSLIHQTAENNIWDDPASGTNTNVLGHSFPNPYTAAQLYAALGYSSKQAFINYAIAHPEAHIQRSARAMLFAGYGL
jgi:hypothetical protein